MKLTKIVTKFSSSVLLLSAMLVPLGASSASAMSASTTGSSTSAASSTAATPTTTNASASTTTATPTTTNGYTAYTVSKTNKTALTAYYIFIGVVWLVVVISLWKVFVKAGQPGWAAIIPIYDIWVLFKIAGKPGWYSLLFLIPLVNIVGLVLYIIALFEVAKKFNKGPAFAIFGLILFTFVGWPILGFGSATYNEAA